MEDPRASPAKPAFRIERLGRRHRHSINEKSLGRTRPTRRTHHGYGRHSSERSGPAALQSENASMASYWANAKKGVLSDPPAFGAFKNGRGEFCNEEVINGKNVFVREIFSDITPNSHHFEQAFSEDQGKTWEPNIIVDLTRTAVDPAADSLTANDRNHD